MRRATGSIVKHGDGWRVHATLHDQFGKPRRVSRVVHGNRKQAERVLRELMEDDYRPEARTIAEVCKMYIRHCEARNRAGELESSSLRGYRSNIERHILPELGDIQLDRLSPSQIRGFVDSLEKNRNSVFRTLRQVMKFAEREELVSVSPVSKVKPPKGRPPAVRREDVYTPEEVAEIIRREKPEQLEIAVAVALGCGLRRGEICGLDWDDYNGTHISVTKAYGKDKPKTPNSIRVVSVPAFARTILDAYRGEGAMIQSADGTRTHPDTISHMWRNYLSGNPDIKPLPFKNLRHTSLTLAYEASGGNIQATSRRGGHSSVSITSRFYVRESSAIDDEIAGSMDELL